MNLNLNLNFNITSSISAPQQRDSISNGSENSVQTATKALQKLLKDSSKKHVGLRKGCQDALDYLTQFQSRIVEQNIPVDDNGLPLNNVELDKLANKLIIPIKFACESRQAKLMTTALDILQKLMAYRYFRGETFDEENPDKPLMVKVIQTIGSCFDYPDDGVQLQIIKAYFTAVTEPICAVHDNLLMNAIRTIYNIYLVSRNQVNQSTAKATLTQMLNTIFQRMESEMSPDVVIGFDETFDEDEIDKKASGELKTPTPALPKKLQPKETPAPQVTEISVDATSPEVIAQQKEDLNEFVHDLVYKMIENAQIESKNAKVSETVRKASNHIFTDCFVIFRALCKLSTKEIPKDANEVNSLDLKSKLLSLELLLSIIENSGPVMRSCVKFINTAIKKYLVLAVLTNGVSPHPKVFRFSLSIFLALVSYFKDYLKNEIGVFYSEIFFYILESPLTSTQQKWMVLQVLLQICKNPQSLVDIFVNYDCGLEGEDIYERMVNDLSKITQGKHVVDSTNLTQQEMKLKTLGLECMVTIMRSLVDWCKDLHFEESETEKDEKLEDKEEKHVHTPGKPWALDPEHPDFHEVKQYKLALAQRIAKFNISPKRGMKLLIEEGFVEDTPEAVAKFLRTTEGLDKTMIGDYLGEKNDFNIKVLHAFIDSFSFKDMYLDLALRRLLATFRLPGEAQKIDRMMEKFAERFFSQNPTSFVNADTVYVLAFATIMLATDLHSPAIKEKDKMKKETWVPMQMKNFENKVDKQIFADIFDRIAAQRLTVNGSDDDLNLDSNELADPKQRRSRFMKEVEKTILKSKQLIKEKMKDAGVYYKAKQIEHSRPMFELASFPMLAAFSVLLEDSDDPEVITLCLEGFKHAVRVSCTFYMDVERNTYVQSLAKFTFLNNMREMKQKNVESIKTLIEIALTEGNYLQDCWLPILRCISQLEQLHVIGSGMYINLLEDDREARVDPGQRKSLTQALSSSFKTFQGQNAHQIVGQIDSMAIDRVFTSSVQLNSNAIEDFVKNLVQVSCEEIDSPNPRLFSLQKLVELAHFNMDRIRMVWARIWSLMAEHFVKVGCNDNVKICMYAVDSLKQLAMKFLEKNEMANYHFQKEFLKPFELITAKNTNVQIRDMIIRCLSNMIHSRANNVKSGWKSIFVVFGVSATVHDESIVHLGHGQLQEIIERYFNLISDSFFVDCVNAFVAFGNNVLYIDVSLKAIQSLQFLSKQLADGNVVTIDAQGTFTDNDRHIALWWPILTGLAGIVSHSHIDVRTSALAALFKTLNMYGHMYNTAMWGLIFRGVLLPIFDNVRHLGATDALQEDNEWLTTTCFNAINSLMNLYSHFFLELKFLLGDLLNLLVSMICQDNESLARIGATSFLQLVMDNGSKLDDEMWTAICTRLSQILETNSPSELFLQLEIPEPEVNEVNVRQSQRLSRIVDDTPRHIKIIKGKSTVRLGLIETLNEIAFTHYSSLGSHHLLILLDSLQNCYQLSLIVQQNSLLVTKIAKTGLLDLLLRIEITAISCYLKVLFRMFAEKSKEPETRVAMAEQRLIGRCTELIMEYIQKSEDKAEMKRMVVGYTQIIVQILKGIGDFYDEQLEKHMATFYPLMGDLLLCESIEIRQVLKSLYLRIGKMKHILV